VRKPANPQCAAAVENPICGRIIGAAFEAFMENGYTATSTLEIATRARVSKRDLYAAFPSKQAVLVACIANRAARMRLSPDLPPPRSRDMLAATLTTFGATVVREVCHPHVVAMHRLAIAEAERSPEVAEALDTTRADNRRALAQLFALAQANGILARGNPEQMTEQFFALLWGDLMLSRLLGAVSSPTPAEIDKRARVATTAFLRIYAHPDEQ
jgi:AcrR family transcriptional regulator